MMPVLHSTLGKEISKGMEGIFGIRSTGHQVKMIKGAESPEGKGLSPEHMWSMLQAGHDGHDGQCRFVQLELIALQI